MSLGVAQLSSLRLGASSTCPVAPRLGVRKIHVRKQVGQSSRHSLAVDAAGTAVQGVVDEEVTFHTEYSPTHRAGEHLHNHTHTHKGQRIIYIWSGDQGLCLCKYSRWHMKDCYLHFGLSVDLDSLGKT